MEKYTRSDKKEFSKLHSALDKMKLNIAAEEVAVKNLSESTINALKDFHKRVVMEENVEVEFNEETVRRLRNELLDIHYADNKYRTKKLHQLLEKAGMQVPEEDRAKKRIGHATRAVIGEFEKKMGLPVKEEITEEVLKHLEHEAIKKTYSSKTKIASLHNTIIRAAGIAKLDVKISADEVKNKELGATSVAALKAFQEKYRLAVTGSLDKPTLDKLTSVSLSRGARVGFVKKTEAGQLNTVNKQLRLNMTSPKVAGMQKALAAMGYKISEDEYRQQFFGKTTREAVLAFQKMKGLALNGHVNADTLRLLNKEIVKANPQAGNTELKYRIRGSVRDELWNRKSNMVLRVYERLLNGESAAPLITKKNHNNGFFDIPYVAPIDPKTGLPKEKFHLVVKLYEPQDNNPAHDKLIYSQIHYNVNRIHWVNFTLSDENYQGDSEFSVAMRILKKAAGNTSADQLEEKEDNKQVTQLSLQTGLSTDILMRLIIAHKASIAIGDPVLSPELFYGFLRQNLPSELPGDLLLGSNQWDTIDQLVETAGTGTIFLDDSTQEMAIDNAIVQNLVPQSVKQHKAAIIDALKKTRADFVLTKPILVGNANLKLLLDASTIAPANYPLVARQFIANKGINDNFWTKIDTEAAVIGANEIKDFVSTVELGNITKNHVPTITFIKNNTGPGKQFKLVSDVAKLTTAEISNLIKANGSKVPDNIPGATTDEQVAVYSQVIKSRSEMLFPAVSLVSSIKRSAAAVQKIDDVEKFVDDKSDFNLRQHNVDQYLRDNAINMDAKAKESLKLVQRIHKLTSDPAIGTALLEEGLHTSARIYFMGRDRLKDRLKSKGIDETKSVKLFEFSKMQYTQILARLLDINPAVNAGTPQAINTYTREEVKAVIKDIPDLEALFGSLDYCDCEHCKSLYGPAAYLADMLKFLDEHFSLITQGGNQLTVKDILLDRRPDIQNIKLNCENTNTPMPYVDLVCEILENNISPAQKDFDFQTTLSAPELRAAPEHIRPYAYQVLAAADFPVRPLLNLWQEESRTYLNFLTVPRHELMYAFQDRSDIANKKPADPLIAGEYFKISSHEYDLITTKRDNQADQDRYWGFDSTQNKISVALFMERSKLSYNELLELLMVRFVNPVGPNRSVIDRPVDTFDTRLQQLTNLTAQKFDLFHRFLRLWRKTGWKMWELDLLLRNPKIGQNVIDETTILNLHKFNKLQDKLSLPLEVLLAFYDNINTEERRRADKPDVLIPTLYEKLFQNKGLTNPLDTKFQLPLNNALVLGINNMAPAPDYNPVPTILSAFAIKQEEFDLLAAKTDGHLSLASLSILLRHVYLSRSLKLPVKDWLLFLTLTGDDPFLTVQNTLDSIERYEFTRSSGLAIQELDYILNFNPDSYAGIRTETLVQYIEALRKILITNKEQVEKLGLTPADRTSIAQFDTTLLPPMNDAQLIAALVPLQSILSAAIDSFREAKFSVDETEYILQISAAPVSAAARTKLIAQADQLKKNLATLLDQNTNQVKSQVAITFSLTDEQADLLLAKLSILPGPAALLSQLQDPGLLAKNADGSYKTIDEVNYPVHFKVYNLLHKVSLLVQKMKIGIKDLKWFIVNHAAVETIDFSALPLAASAPDFTRWLNLYKFLDFKSRFPEPEEASIRSILTLAGNLANTKERIFEEIEKLTRWTRANLLAIHKGLSLKHEHNAVLNKDLLDYTKADTYLRLEKCFEQIKLTGKDASTMFTWAVKDNDIQKDIQVALETKQAVKSKFEQDDWLAKATPLNDTIREQKRSALVAYHIEESLRNQAETVNFNGADIPNPLYWRDSNALFKYFLIDVEMCPLQLSSRIKQAISSVQLFVQRCFLNLENRFVKVSQAQKEDVSSPNAWSQWKWMKNYRIWEANRKVFFYPENWIEPELRDDKSPFFQELENELMQKEVTHENVEAAFLNYLYKVDEVSNLEVCGLYHEMDDLNPEETGFEKNIVHVIGRSRSTPPAYFYRSYNMVYSTWSAWEKIEIDIVSDHVVPVVYNRKLHLFWLTFMEKPMKAQKQPAAKASASPSDTPEPMKMLEIQLGWTIRKKEGWTPKKISNEKLIHPWQRPQHSYNLKPYYNSKFNELYMDIYISTSKEFNNGKFYDPFKDVADNPVSLTANTYDETYLPWHSSSFVFNGHIKDVRMKALNGQYHMEYASTRNALTGTDSFEYVHGNFSQNGSFKRLEMKDLGPRLRLPNGMHYYNNHLRNNLNHSVNGSQLRVLENTGTNTLLRNAISPFELVATQQDLQVNTATDHPLFYQDAKRVFFIKPEWEDKLDNYGRVQSQVRKYHFHPFYHPYTTLFIRELNRKGIDGLLNRRIQVYPETFPPSEGFSFNSYSPDTNAVVAEIPAQTDVVDFSFGGATSIYNWEMFFHAPLMIACRLSQNQRFEESMRWFHYIFNPTDVEDLPSPQRYWVTKPFFEYNADAYRKQRIENILNNIQLPEYKDQLIAWKNNPFKPHLIARYRPVAYQKNVVMKYINNLNAWGDQLFRRDTIESINEATLLYMLAYEILGRRPEKVPDVKTADKSFKELEAALDAMANAKVDVLIENTLSPIHISPSTGGDEPMPKIETFYFAIPPNDYLFKYWDTVEDRLFKIRNCMNIEGVVRQLPLFEPPIDPALLVKAAAAGMDLSSVLDDMATAIPHYRFRMVVQKAIDFCNDVRALGEKLLAALDRKDVEELALLRSQFEIDLLKAIKEVRKKQIDEAGDNIKNLNKALELTEAKQTYYDSIPRMNDWEIGGVVSHSVGIGFEIAATVANTLAAGVHLVPQIKAGASGFGGTPTVTLELGGNEVGNSAGQFGVAFQGIAGILHSLGSLLENQGNYTRRDNENKFQSSQAKIEQDQIKFQISAAEIRQAIAEKELENQELQIENSEAVDEYMRNKYTNSQLYQWMIGQLSAVYFQAYQLAYDMAKKAEKCYQYELGVQTSNIIQFGYWDSLKKGLLSGDKLLTDLRKLEATYIEQNKREFEMVRHVSLAQVAPLSLMELKEKGACTVSLPEFLFDMDYPGHYMRRIKNVSVTIPCVAGPYTNINCTLSLLKNKIRIDNTLSAGKYEEQPDDTRFKTRFGPISSIATSHAQNDNGLFELNFNDERYLPFEGCGAVSEWEISMPKLSNQFDFSTLSDVVIHIQYTARSGGGQLANAANAYVQTLIPSSAARLFSLRHEFGTGWYRFLHPENGNDQELVFALDQEQFAYYIRGRLNTLKVKKLDLFLESDHATTFDSQVKVTSAASSNVSITKDASFGNVHHASIDLSAINPNALGEVRMKVKPDTAADFKSLGENVVKDAYVLVQLGS